MADPLETEVGRFEYYKKKFEAEKANIPQLSGVPPNVLDIATKKSNQWEFPPFGVINFKDVPNGLDEERFVSKKVDDVLRGTVKYVHELEGQPPVYLNGWGITSLPLFEDSAATKNLVAKTKTDYSKIVEEMDNLESGYETGFNNKEMKKLTSRDLHDLLDATMLDFLKEIGVNRSGGGVKQNDDLILESSQKIYEFLTKGSTPAQPAAPVQQEPAMKTQETGVKVKETQKMEPVPTSPAVPAAPTTPAAPTQQQTTTVVEKSQPPIEPAQPSAPVQNTSTAEPANTATPETANQPVISQSNTSFTEPGSVSGSASVSTPLLDLLGASSGMSSDDIAKMFQGEGGMEKLQQGLDLSFPGSTVKTEAIATAVGQTQPVTAAQQQNATANAPVATKTAEPAKIAEAIQAPPEPPQAPPAPVTPQEAPKEAAPNPPSTEDKGKSSEDASAQETKQAEETKNKEQDQTNAELLKVMKDILKALHGPLIVTDGKHNFS